jgi:hypothetical protein
MLLMLCVYVPGLEEVEQRGRRLETHDILWTLRCPRLPSCSSSRHVPEYSTAAWTCRFGGPNLG